MQTLHEKIELAHRIANAKSLVISNCGTQDKPKWVLFNSSGRIAYRSTIDGMLRLVKQVTGYK